MKRSHITTGLWVALTLLAAAGCATSQPGAVAGDAKAAVGDALDRWHVAAAQADADAYFGGMTAGGVFLGTDAGERWTRREFRAAYGGHFERGKAWTFRPQRRAVVVGPGGAVAWFDELLDSDHLGQLRGSGVLVKRDGRWLVAHYDLSIPIPNDLADQVVDDIRAHLKGAAAKP